MKLRAIIADDEPLARERVRSLLADEPDVEIVAECGNGAQTLKATQEHRPDLLFLDIQMPRLNGFEVLQALKPEQIPIVIFTTAHDQHAIQAFEVNALDYLLKPCTEARFRKAVQRAREQLQKNPSESHAQLAGLLEHLRAALSSPTNPQLPKERPLPSDGRGIKGEGNRILIRTPDRILFLKPEEIDHAEAAGNYVVLHAGKERHIVRETTAAMESRLTPAGFMRISRSVIVNLARIREVQPVGPNQYSVLLKNGTRLDMTCTLRDLQSRLAEV